MRSFPANDRLHGAFDQFATLYLRDRFQCDAFVVGTLAPSGWVPLLADGAQLNAASPMLHKLAQSAAATPQASASTPVTLSDPSGPEQSEDEQAPLITSRFKTSKSARVMLTGRTHNSERYLAVLIKEDVSAASYQRFVVDRLQSVVGFPAFLTALTAQAGLRRFATDLQCGYDKLRIGVIIADADGRQVYANGCARDWLSLEFGSDGAASGANGDHYNGQSSTRFLFSLVKAVRGEQTTRVSQNEAVTTIWRQLINGDQKVPFFVMPLGEEATVGGRYCIVFPDLFHKFDPMEFLRGLGLTAAESRLASEIIDGKSLKTASVELSLSEESARTYLKRVFSKLGVSRQAELVSTVARLSTPVGGRINGTSHDSDKANDFPAKSKSVTHAPMSPTRPRSGR